MREGDADETRVRDQSVIQIQHKEAQMPVIVRIPTPLQKLTGDKGAVDVSAASVKELIEQLESSYPGIKDRICDDKGKVRRFVNIFLNQQDIRFLEQESTKLKDGDEISIVPAIAGGSR